MRQHFSVNLELTDSVRPADQQAPAILLPPPPQQWNCRHTLPCQAFSGGAGDQVLVFAQPSISPAPWLLLGMKLWSGLALHPPLPRPACGKHWLCLSIANFTGCCPHHVSFKNRCGQWGSAGRTAYSDMLRYSWIAGRQVFPSPHTCHAQPTPAPTSFPHAFPDFTGDNSISYLS